MLAKEMPAAEIVRGLSDDARAALEQVGGRRARR